MRFRVTDEQEWSHVFDADDPDALIRGVRHGLAAYSDSGVHPAFWPAALRSRLDEIDEWLQRKLSTPGATAQQRRSWTANAEHERYLARMKYSEASLFLQVLGDRGSGKWLSPLNRIPTPRVRYDIDAETAKRLFAESASIVAYDEKLAVFLNVVVPDVVASAIPDKPLPPHLVLIKTELLD